MRIRITQSCSGPGGVYAKGHEMDYRPDLMWLLNGGLAVPIREDDTIETADKPVHKGGGWYELPDGRRIKGKGAAEAAMEG